LPIIQNAINKIIIVIYLIKLKNFLPKAVTDSSRFSRMILLNDFGLPKVYSFCSFGSNQYDVGEAVDCQKMPPF